MIVQIVKKLLRWLIDWLDLFYYRLATFNHNHYDPGGFWNIAGAFPPAFLLVTIIVLILVIIVKLLHVPFSSDDMFVLSSTLLIIVQSCVFPESKYQMLEKEYHDKKTSPFAIFLYMVAFLLGFLSLFLDHYIINL